MYGSSLQSLEKGFLFLVLGIRFKTALSAVVGFSWCLKLGWILDLNIGWKMFLFRLIKKKSCLTPVLLSGHRTPFSSLMHRHQRIFKPKWHRNANFWHEMECGFLFSTVQEPMYQPWTLFPRFGTVSFIAKVLHFRWFVAGLLHSAGLYIESLLKVYLKFSVQCLVHFISCHCGAEILWGENSKNSWPISAMLSLCSVGGRNLYNGQIFECDICLLLFLT